MTVDHIFRGSEQIETTATTKNIHMTALVFCLFQCFFFFKSKERKKQLLSGGWGMGGGAHRKRPCLYSFMV